MNYLVASTAAVFIFCACTAPRSVLYSPQASAKGQFRFGAALSGNIPTQTTAALESSLEKGIDDVYRRTRTSDSVAVTADSLNTFARALIAYSLDPVGATPNLWIRYGLLPRLDLGYRYAGGHAFDVRCQFLGPLIKDSVAAAWSGSLGLQYSSQSYDLPSIIGLDKVQDLLQFEFTRRDFVVPLVFGRPFGVQGRYGDFGLGLVYDLAFISYGSDITKLVEKIDNGSRRFEKLEGERTISAYGGFANVRLGYKFVFAVASLSSYYQDYGTYKLFGGATSHLAGWTFLPSVGLEFRI